DYVEFMISTNGGSNWSPLCGKYTNQGGINQDHDEPLYDGFQSDWVFEEIDLSGYLGQNNIRFRFKLKSDQGVTEDGYYFDDFSISTDGTEGIDDFTAGNLQIYPNPASNELMITVDKHIHLD